jgi:hypothetical protein
MSASRGRLRTRALPDRVPRAVGGHVAGPVPDADASGVAPGRPSSRDRPAGRQAPERGGADPSERGPRCRPNLSGRFLCRQDFVAHSWPKRRSDDWLNHAEPVRRRVEKYLQIGPFRGVRRRTSSCPTRPVTPEVAGSSPVAPVSLFALQNCRGVLSHWVLALGLRADSDPILMGDSWTRLFQQ